MPHGSAVPIRSLHNDHDILAKDFFRRLTKRLAVFRGIYRIKPDFELLAIVAKARERVAVVNANDTQEKLLGFGFVAAVREGLDAFGLGRAAEVLKQPWPSG